MEISARQKIVLQAEVDQQKASLREFMSLLSDDEVTFMHKELSIAASDQDNWAAKFAVAMFTELRITEVADE